MTESSLACVSPRAPGEQRRELLPEPGLTVSPSAPNLLKSELYRDALPRVSPAGNAKRATTALVIPDYAARIAILDFEGFPPKVEDRLELLRFRLRKSVPFPIDEAQLAYAIQMEQAGRVEVLVVAIARPILAEYEGVFVDGGYRLGLVIPSSIAALRLCDRGEAGLTRAREGCWLDAFSNSARPRTNPAGAARWTLPEKKTSGRGRRRKR